MFKVFVSKRSAPVDVLFCIEHYDREIEVAVAIADALMRRGICVAIASSIMTSLPLRTQLPLKL